MRAAHAAAAGAALLLGACASDKVLLLPNEDGASTGAVAVIDEKKGGEVVVDRPLTEARLAARTRPKAVKRLDKSRGLLLESLPKGAVGFVLNFFTDTIDLRPESRPVLDELRRAVGERPGAEIEVVGYTDTVGPEDYNDRLSQDRAEAVVKMLVAQGFAADQLTATGRGERDLFIPTADEVANPQNRRVEVVVR